MGVCLGTPSLRSKHCELSHVRRCGREEVHGVGGAPSSCLQCKLRVLHAICVEVIICKLCDFFFITFLRTTPQLYEPPQLIL